MGGASSEAGRPARSSITFGAAGGGSHEDRFSVGRGSAAVLLQRDMREYAALSCLLNEEDRARQWSAGSPPLLLSPRAEAAVDAARSNLARVEVRWAGQRTQRVLSTADLAALRGAAVRDIANGLGAAGATLIPVPAEAGLDEDEPLPPPGRVQAQRLPLIWSVPEQVRPGSVGACIFP